MATGRVPAPARVATARLGRTRRVELLRLVPSARALLVGFGVVAVAGGAYAVARTSPMFAVRTIDVRGAPPRVQAEIRRALAGDLGSSLLALSGEAVVQRVEALPDVAAASYDRDFPHTLRLVIRPERPVAVLRRGRASWLVSARARVLRAIEPGTHRGLPRVWLPRSASVEVGQPLDAAEGSLSTRALARVRSRRFANGVRGAVLSHRDGLVFVLRSGVEIHFGRTIDLPLKLAVAERIAPLLPLGTTMLDLSVPERPVSDDNPQPEG